MDKSVTDSMRRVTAVSPLTRKLVVRFDLSQRARTWCVGGVPGHSAVSVKEYHSSLRRVLSARCCVAAAGERKRMASPSSIPATHL